MSQPASDALPFYLEGNFAPVSEEVTAVDLPVQGAIPPQLRGLYLRNGPNPRPGRGDPGHWFLGDGMVHGVRLEDGKAAWYRNRWVRSRVFEYQRHRARGPDPSAGRELVSHRAHARARHAGNLRLRRKAHHRHDGAPQALSHER
jgi:carotenoid cleavage dioxygenase